MGKYFLHLDAPFVLLLLAEEKNPGAHYELWRSYGYDGIMWPYVTVCGSTRHKNQAATRDVLRHPAQYFNAKLPRNNGRLTGRWCIHSRANQTGDMLSHIMERRQLCAVSTLHQPRRHTNNATYLAKDSRYGPSQIDYILASCRWASSAHKSRVKWGVSCGEAITTMV